MSIPEKSKTAVIVNPMSILYPVDNDRPNWICKHRHAKVLDANEMIYDCKVCCKYGPVKIIADEFTALRNAKK